MKKMKQCSIALLLPLTLLSACRSAPAEMAEHSDITNAQTTAAEPADSTEMRAVVIEANIQAEEVYDLMVLNQDDPSGMGYISLRAENVSDNICAGDTVSITYTGGIYESFPSQIMNVSSVLVTEHAPNTEYHAVVASVSDTEVKLSDDESFELYNFYEQPRYTLLLSLFQERPEAGDTVLITYSGQLEKGEFRNVQEVTIIES